MKNLLALALVFGAASTSVGSQASPIQAPAKVPSGVVHVQGVNPHHVNRIQPIPDVQPGTVIGDASGVQLVPLYKDVKVLFPKNIAPCAVRKVVAVPDPCNPCCCVFVEICVPPCGCEEVVTVHPRLDRVTFDYGEYRVRITERKGTLVIAYLK
ncbi:hypothetical protein [Planctomicrobium sp. SH527]|uniref:hypothetical protein n=1 Tax=Planctomicrobium sp. SH527 TaxID=3448123 RepID=UPI003F5C4190